MGFGTVWKKGIAIFVSVVCLTGCGADADAPEQTPEDGGDLLTVSVENAPVLDYELPTMLPGIRVSRIGFEPSSRKTAVLTGGGIPETFRIVDAASGETVYTGRTEDSGYNDETGEYNGYMEFSDLTEEGEYYIECDILGRSYDFIIREDLDSELLDEGISRFQALGEKIGGEDFIDACKGVSVLLLSFELYSGVYEEKKGEDGVPTLITALKEYAEVLLAAQDAKTGAIVFDGEERPEETAWCSAALAKFCYTYQKYDSAYATTCLQASDRAWRFVEKNRDAVEESVRFFAAAELYRATGQNGYRNTAEELAAGLPGDARDEAGTLGTFTYTATKRKVSRDLCGKLLKVFLSESESISERAKSNAYMVAGGMGQNTPEEMRWDALVVSASDYVITNSEYGALVLNYYHYFAGANEKAARLIYPDSAGGEAAGAQSKEIAEYIMVLSKILSRRQEE